MPLNKETNPLSNDIKIYTLPRQQLWSDHLELILLKTSTLWSILSWKSRHPPEKKKKRFSMYDPQTASVCEASIVEFIAITPSQLRCNVSTC